MTTIQPNIRYNHIFKNHEGVACTDVKQATKKTNIKGVVDDNKKFSKEIAALNHGIATRDREVQQRLEQRKDYEDKIAKHGKVVRVAKLSDMFAMIDVEIETTLKKTSWKRLSDAYKWKFIKAYVDTCDCLDKSSKKKVLSSLKKNYNELANVEYHMADTRVIKLNVNLEGHDL